MKVDEAIEWMKEINHDYVKGDASEDDMQKYTASYMAIEALEKQKTFDNGTWVDKDYHDKVYALLQERYFKALGHTRWIPVSERLPDADVGSILIYTKNGGVAEGQCYPTIKAWKQFRWSVENANVTHWMPLPEPPEQEV